MSAPTLFLTGTIPGSAALTTALTARGIRVCPVAPDTVAITRACLTAPGLVLVDGGTPDVFGLVEAAVELGFDVVVRGAPTVPFDARIRHLDAGLSPEDEAHHLADLLRASTDGRRHPRVPWRGRGRLGETDVFIVDVSPFGLRLRGAMPADDAEYPVVVDLGEGRPEIRLIARPVGRYGTDLALRCRPERDVDLVLWVDLILAALAHSPAHRELDPFGSLFEP